MSIMRRSSHGRAAMAAAVLLLAACGAAAPSPSSSPGSTSDGAVPASPSTGATGPDTWLPAGAMAVERGAFRAVQLLDGRVLVVGNDNDCAPGGPWADSATTEIYDPADDSWTVTAPLDQPRGDFAAVRLLDGRVLVAGGQSGGPTGEATGPLATTRIWDPIGQAWGEGGSLGSARGDPAATLLADGRVLIAGGVQLTDRTRALPTAEIFDPKAATATPTTGMVRPRVGGTAMTMPDGRVVLFGGTDIGDDRNRSVRAVERYDPAADSWTVIGELPVGQEHTAVMLADGSILLAGGHADERGLASEPLATAWRLDPLTGALTQLASMPTPRRDALATLLDDGRVLLAGGADGIIPAAGAAFQLVDTSSGAPAVTASAVIYDPVTDTWTETAPMPSPVAAGISVVLQDGSVLVAGGPTGWGPASAPWCPNLTANAVRFMPGAP